MKLIKVPDAIEVKVERPDGRKFERTLTFVDFVRESVENCETFARGLKNVRKADRILRAVESLDGQSALKIESEDFEALKDAVDKMGWLPAVARRLLPFYEAIESAEDSH